MSTHRPLVILAAAALPFVPQVARADKAGVSCPARLDSRYVSIRTPVPAFTAHVEPGSVPLQGVDVMDGPLDQRAILSAPASRTKLARQRIDRWELDPASGATEFWLVCYYGGGLELAWRAPPGKSVCVERVAVDDTGFIESASLTCE